MGVLERERNKVMSKKKFRREFESFEASSHPLIKKPCERENLLVGLYLCERKCECVCDRETHKGTLVPREEWKEIETDGKEGMGGREAQKTSPKHRRRNLTLDLLLWRV